MEKQEKIRVEEALNKKAEEMRERKPFHDIGINRVRISDRRGVFGGNAVKKKAVSHNAYVVAAVREKMEREV